MPSAYETSYHKIARVDDLAVGKPYVFRAAGATIIVRRSEQSVSAIDGSCLAEEGRMPSEVRIKRILECVASGVGASSPEWDELETRAGLPTRIDDGEIWVCIDACRQ